METINVDVRCIYSYARNCKPCLLSERKLLLLRCRVKTSPLHWHCNKWSRLSPLHKTCFTIQSAARLISDSVGICFPCFKNENRLLPGTALPKASASVLPSAQITSRSRLPAQNKTGTLRADWLGISFTSPYAALWFNSCYRAATAIFEEGMPCSF